MGRSQDSFNKRDREKKRAKKKKEKAERKEQRKAEGTKTAEFMYLDANGNLTETPPDPTVKKEVIKAEDIHVSTPKQGKTAKPSSSRTGVVKFFNDEKGYGFINDSVNGDSFFVHIDALIDRIRDNDKVAFEAASGPKGPVAKEVRLL